MMTTSLSLIGGKMMKPQIDIQKEVQPHFKSVWLCSEVNKLDYFYSVN